MNTKRKGFNAEKVIAFALIAMCATIGIITFMFLVLGIDARTVDPADLISLFSIGTGVLWGALLCKS